MDLVKDYLKRLLSRLGICLFKGPGLKLNESKRRLGDLVAGTVLGLCHFSGFSRLPSDNAHDGGCLNLPQTLSWIANVDSFGFCISFIDDVI